MPILLSALPHVSLSFVLFGLLMFHMQWGSALGNSSLKQVCPSPMLLLLLVIALVVLACKPGSGLGRCTWPSVSSCAVLCSAALYCTVPYYTVPYCMQLQTFASAGFLPPLHISNQHRLPATWATLSCLMGNFSLMSCCHVAKCAKVVGL